MSFCERLCCASARECPANARKSHCRVSSSAIHGNPGSPKIAVVRRLYPNPHNAPWRLPAHSASDVILIAAKMWYVCIHIKSLGVYDAAKTGYGRKLLSDVHFLRAAWIRWQGRPGFTALLSSSAELPESPRVHRPKLDLACHFAVSATSFLPAVGI